MRILVVILTSCLLAACASSPEPQANNEVAVGEARIVSPDYFLDYIYEIQLAVQDGKPRELSEREMETVNGIVDDLREMLVGVENIQAMESRDKHKIFNATEELWATIHENEYQPVVCEEAARVGSRIKSTDCRSARQLNTDKAQYRNFMRESIYSSLIPPPEL